MKRSIGLLLGLVMISACTNASPSPATELLAMPSSTAVPSGTHPFTRTPPPAHTPTPSVTPTPECQNPTGFVVETTYVGSVIREPFNVRIFLPPCYEASQQTYPTLYLLHGSPFDETHWDELGADEVAGAAMQDGTWPPFIIVMPYAPTILFTGTDGGSWSYEAEFVNGLVPWVDSNYRTITYPYWRGFAGISRGGVWALEIALRYPNVIDSVAALSPALAYNRGRPEFDPFQLIYRGTPRPQRILLMAGDEDWARGETERLSQALELLDIPHRLMISPGGHEDETWSRIMQDVLEFFATAWLKVY